MRRLSDGWALLLFLLTRRRLWKSCTGVMKGLGVPSTARNIPFVDAQDTCIPIGARSAGFGQLGPHLVRLRTTHSLGGCKRHWQHDRTKFVFPSRVDCVLMAMQNRNFPVRNLQFAHKHQVLGQLSIHVPLTPQSIAVHCTKSPIQINSL